MTQWLKHNWERQGWSKKYVCANCGAKKNKEYSPVRYTLPNGEPYYGKSMVCKIPDSINNENQ